MFLIIIIGLSLHSLSIYSNAEPMFNDSIRYFTPEDSIVYRNTDPVFSPSSRFVSTSDLRVFDSITGAQMDVGPIEGRLTAWSSKNPLLCVASDEFITIWNTTTWAFERKIDLQKPLTSTDFLVYDLDWVKDTLAILQNEGYVTIIDSTTWQQTQMKMASQPYVRMTLNPDATILAVAYISWVDLFRVSDGELVRTLYAGAGTSVQMDWSSDGTFLYNIGDWAIVYWYTGNWTMVQKGFIGVTDGAIDDTNRLIYAVDGSEWVMVFSHPDLRLITNLKVGMANLRYVAVSHNSTLLFVLGDGMVMVHLPSKTTLFNRVRGNVGSEVCACSSRYIAFGNLHRFEVWDLDMRTMYERIEPIAPADYNSLSSLAFSADGAFLAYATSHGFIRIHNMSSKWDEVTFTSQSSFEYIAWHPYRNRVAFIDNEGLIKIYDHTTGEFQPSIQAIRTTNQFAKWSPDGETFCYGLAPTKQLVFINYSTRAQLKVLTDWNGIPAGDFSPGGRYFIYPGKGNYPVIVDTATWVQVASLSSVDYTLGLQWGPTNHSVLVRCPSGIELWWVSNFTMGCKIYQEGPLARFGTDELEIVSLARDVVRFKAPYSFINLTAPDKVDENRSVDMNAVVLATNYPLSFYWDLGDGSTATGANVQYAWTRPGIYDVSLTAVHERGFSVTMVRAIEVLDRTPPHAIIVGPFEVDEDRLVEYDGSASTDNLGIERFLWVFGDGSVYFTETVIHTFEEPGPDFISLTVFDRAGLLNTIAMIVTVHDITSPFADFYCPTIVPEDVTINLTGTNSTDNVGITSYEWRISNGRTYNTENISFAFAIPGVYKVHLNVSDAEHNLGWMECEVIVTDRTLPIIDYSIAGSMNEDVPMVFDAGNSSDEGSKILEFLWRFPNNETRAVSNVTYVFDEPGPYTIFLRVMDSTGNSNETVIRVVIRDTTPPNILVDASSRRVPEDVNVSFDGSLSWDNVAIVSYRWEFEPGASSKEAIASHSFMEPGIYHVRFIVADASGLENSTTVEVTVVDTTPPVIVLEPVGAVNLEAGSSGRSRLVLNASRSFDNVGITNVLWKIDGRVFAENISILDTELPPGGHLVTVVISDGAGRTSTMDVNVNVVEKNVPGTPIWNIVIVIFLIVSLSIICILIYRKKKGKE